MACQRNRIIKITQYLSSRGVTVNIGKNQARGNRGVFLGVGKSNFRIDITKELNEDSILQVLIHEFTHYVHYCYDSKMMSLDFLYKDITEDLLEELVNITIAKVPKSFAQELYNAKYKLQNEIKELGSFIKSLYPEFRLSVPQKTIERNLRVPVKYLLKYDKIQILNKVYSITNIDNDFPSLSSVQIAYLSLKSKQRAQKRVNSRICKLNKYYNRPAELLARFAEVYFLEPDKSYSLAPKFSNIMDNIIKQNKIPEFSTLKELLSNVEVF